MPSETLLGMFQLPMKISDTIHLIFAVSFFVICGLNSIFLFTLSSKKPKDMEAPKKIRNWIYRISGIIILLSLIILGILMKTIPAEDFDSRRLVLIFEIIMLASFGAAWIIKGNTLFKDSIGV